MFQIPLLTIVVNADKYVLLKGKLTGKVSNEYSGQVICGRFILRVSVGLESNEIFYTPIHMTSLAPSGSVSPYTGSELPGIGRLDFEKHDLTFRL